ncbi:EF-hand domain-containing protein [Caenorhabditis elegans]|uniref:EF-hand domain-containing protein n=1 Tax=Caenorhabditis elegans TaxID=6239 RepID=Q9GZH6_CAEEL|nr:EF-hand domain-containing protein [Caenorhabditis elegans]CCD62021.1 EF-hand domain-containing protein [Caenorhabditis elegans]|eukprot:NP_501063.1 Uncharacterized protein CELE_T22D1.5 [Caenorhabditis elegans]
MSQQIQMKSVIDVKFPTHLFSPLATSSPKLTRMRAPIRDQSWSSCSDDSSGNLTSQAITGVDDSHIEATKLENESSTSSCSMHTALEFVNSSIFERVRSYSEVITREELQSAIFERKLTETDCSKEEAEMYSIIVTERILWTAGRTWTGTIQVKTKDLLNDYVRYACEDWYMKHTGQLCAVELNHIGKWDEIFDSNAIAIYCYETGIPTIIVDRIFSSNLVRRSTGNYLDTKEVTWLIFAMIGTDENQSIEYWFRVLDVQSTGILQLDDLRMFYDAITKFLVNNNVQSLPFENAIAQFRDILGTDKWNLQSFKKNSQLAFRVINGFVCALRFLEQEICEKTNTERQDDEEFGMVRTRWQRLIDHKFDDYYAQSSTSSSGSFNINNEPINPV